MKPSSAIAKGKELENHIADQIVAHGLDPTARRDSGSGNGNREKGDIVTSLTILGRNAGIEAKNCSTLKIPEWWRQAEKLEVLGREPVLAFKMRGEGYEATKCVIYLDTLLKLLAVAKQGNGEVLVGETRSPEAQRELKWAVEGLKAAAAKVARLL